MKSFEDLLKILNKMSFEKMTETNETYLKHNFSVDCEDNEVYVDDDLYEFLKFLKIKDIKNEGNHVLLFFKNHTYRIPCQDVTNRFNPELPFETILMFDEVQGVA